MSRGQLWPQEAEDCSCWSSGLHYLEAGSKIGMGTIPSELALGAGPAVAVHPEEELFESRAAHSSDNFQQDLPEEEWTGPLLIEDEEDGGEGEWARTGPTAEDQLGPPEEEPSSVLAIWHLKGVLGLLCVDPGDSPDPGRLSSVTEEARDEAGRAAPAAGEEEEEGSQAGSRCELPLGEEVGRMEQDSLLGSKAHRAPPQSCCIQAEGAAGEEQECPICTEVYDHDRCKPALLNCSHVLCGRCLRAILEAASSADIGRVRCPICRQKTPMMEWEICRLQEELLLLSSTQGPTVVPPAFGPLPPQQPGFWGGLEHRFQVRFHTSRVMGFFPCLRYPACLIGGLARLECRCRWGYRAALLGLAAAEMLSLLLVFLPIFLLLLLFLILDK
ncbi:ring finger protein-like [Candoia aspera]|uniref:ring finger protein-like n=1 Tax=Candoia aspera TaxID=51853 RepID=UPI002FD83FED